MNPSRFSRLAVLSAVIVVASGCAAYRTSSSTDAPAAPAAASTGPIIVTEGAMADRKYQALGKVDVSVKKLTLFHKDPTREMANEALTEKARALGADAVINVKYTSGIGFTTWGYIDATGTAIKFAK